MVKRTQIFVILILSFLANPLWAQDPLLNLNLQVNKEKNVESELVEILYFPPCKLLWCAMGNIALRHTDTKSGQDTVYSFIDFDTNEWKVMLSYLNSPKSPTPFTKLPFQKFIKKIKKLNLTLIGYPLYLSNQVLAKLKRNLNNNLDSFNEDQQKEHQLTLSVSILPFFHLLMNTIFQNELQEFARFSLFQSGEKYYSPRDYFRYYLKEFPLLVVFLEILSNQKIDHPLQAQHLLQLPEYLISALENISRYFGSNKTPAALLPTTFLGSKNTHSIAKKEPAKRLSGLQKFLIYYSILPSLLLFLYTFVRMNPDNEDLIAFSKKAIFALTSLFGIFTFSVSCLLLYAWIFASNQFTFGNPLLFLYWPTDLILIAVFFSHRKSMEKFNLPRLLPGYLLAHVVTIILFSLVQYMQHFPQRVEYLSLNTAFFYAIFYFSYRHFLPKPPQKTLAS